jgi:excisionase family DNA binding protein
MPEPLLLRPVEAAEALRISRAKVYALIASGELPHVQVGRFARVPVGALRAWIAEHSQVRGAAGEAAGARGEQR